MLRCYVHVALFSVLEFELFLIQNILHLLISFLPDTNVIRFSSTTKACGQELRPVLDFLLTFLSRHTSIFQRLERPKL